jgi:hypothetical protein
MKPTTTYLRRMVNVYAVVSRASETWSGNTANSCGGGILRTAEMTLFMAYGEQECLDQR